MLCTKLIKLNTKTSKPMTLEEAFKQYEKFLHKLAHKWSGTCEYDELFQLASIGLIKAYNTYDVAKGFNFMTYLGRVVTNEILQFNRKSRKHAAVQSTETVIHLDKNNNEFTVSEIIADETNYEELVLDKIDKENLPVKIRSLINSLSPREKEVIIYRYIHGLEQKAIGEKLGISQSYISRVIKDGLEKMRKNYKQ